MSYVFLVSAVISEVIGTAFMRVAAQGRARCYAVVGVAYTLALYLLVRTLSEGMGIGVAYGIWAAAGVALTALVSRFVFKEPITRMMWCGMALIAVGVVLIEGGAHA